MLQENVNLKPYNTFGINITTDFFYQFNNIQELKEVLSKIRNQKHLILGGGSNVLFQNDFKGIVLVNRILGKRIIEENEEQVIIEAGAGEIWHQFVLYTIENNWGGLENLSLIPGCVGASPMQNIGAYGIEIKDVFHSLDALEINSGKIRTFTKEECQFGYRESIFKRALKDQYIITAVRYQLSKEHQLNTSYGAIEQELASKGITQPTIRDVSDAVIAIRQSKLPNPKEIGNGGSFFKNPIIDKKLFHKIKEAHPEIPSYPIDEKTIKVPAGWLIDHAGWKGKTINNYGVHKNQALVLVNYGGASGKEIFQLSEDIIQDIYQKFQIKLEREVNIIY